MIFQATVIITFVLVTLTFLVPRKYFLLPYILAACFVPADQRIVIMGLDFTILRILVVAGFLRIILRGEQLRFKLNRFDKLVIVWAICGATVYVLQWMDLRALIYKCGVLYDVVGMYWLFRQRICSWSDITFAFKTLAVCSLILVLFVAYEWITGNNPFSAIGQVATVVREGRYRCQASFRHSILLGLFWATLFPVFVTLYRSDYHKYLYLAAAGAAVFMVCATTSSTPLVTLAIVILLLAVFPYRQYGKQAAWALCGLTLALHLVMKAPVWHLISRINLVGGSTGWHRYNLIDKAIEHFGEWAFMGCRSTSEWGRGLSDITNQYVLEGVRGGLLTLSIFLVLLFVAAKTAGAYSLSRIPKQQQWFVWGICVSVLGHCVSFFGVSYFGQITMLLLLSFAIVSFLYESLHRPSSIVSWPRQRSNTSPSENSA
jgi:hypothetical protein